MVNVVSDLFVVLDSRPKIEYEKNINGLMSKDKHLAILLHNQTNTPEKTMNLLKLNWIEPVKRNEQSKIPPST